jgi:hypothetical protein
VRNAARPAEAAGTQGAGAVGAVTSTAATHATEEGVSLAELVALFVGDDDALAYPHLNLVLAICERLRPESPSQIVELLYPVRLEAPDELVDRIIRWGYELWLQHVYERDPEEWHELARTNAR